MSLHRSAPLTPADVATPAAGSADGTSPVPAIPSRATKGIRARIRWTYGNGPPAGLPGQ